MKSLGLMKSLALLGLALLALTPRSVQAQASNPNCWTATDANGNPIRQEYNGDWLLTGPIAITTSPTGVYQQMQSAGADWGSFAPFASSASSPLNDRFSLDTFAGDGGLNWQSLYNGSLIGGSVSARADSTQSATLTYTPLPGNTSPQPDHVDLLLTTYVYANAGEGYDDLSYAIEEDLFNELSLEYGWGDVPPPDFVFPSFVLPTATLSSSVTVTDSWGDQLSASASSQDAAWDSDNEQFDSGANNQVISRHLVRVPVTNGVGTVSVTGHAAATASNDSNQFHDLGGNYGGSWAGSYVDITTAAAFDNREVGISTTLDGLPQNGTAAANSDPTNRQLTAYASLNWKVQDDDSPSIPFYDGYAKYFLDATGFTPTTYTWQTSQAPFVQSQATPDDLTWELPDYSVGEKRFHFDLGDDPTQFPKTTTVTGTASGNDPSFGLFSGTGTVTVTWHSPWANVGNGGGGGGPLSLTPAAGANVILAEGPNGTAVPANTVTAGQVILLGGQRYRVFTVQQNADGTITFFLVPAAAAPAPQDDDDIMALVAEYQQRTQQVIQVGKIGLRLGFEGYNQLGQAYVLGPLTELTAPQLVELLGEAATVLGRSLEGTQAAGYYTALGSYGTSLLPVLAQKVADLEAGVAAGTASEADLAAANQALEETQTCISICNQAAADMGGTYSQYNSTGTEVNNAVLDAQDWQAETAAGKNCFAAGTLVWMADGSQKPIEQVRASDLVLSRDPQTGVTAAKAVLRTFRHQADAMVSLRFPGGDTLQCTAGHPFYVSGQGFVPAGMLALGSSIVTRAGPLLALSGSERQSVPTTVYNFEVADFHTYFVGKSGLWVHNICGIPDDLEPRAEEDPDTQEDIQVYTPLLGGGSRTITGLDFVSDPDPNGAIWVIEKKEATGQFEDGRNGGQLTNMDDQQLNNWIDDHVIGKLNKYLEALQIGTTVSDVRFGSLANLLDAPDSAYITQMLQQGKIRIGYQGQVGMHLRVQERIMTAIREWEQAHASELGGNPVGFVLR